MPKTKMKTEKETTQLNVEIPTELHRDVKVDAAKEGMTLAELVIWALTNRPKNRPARPSRAGKRQSFDTALGQSQELSPA
jgi:hypothetical protein